MIFKRLFCKHKFMPYQSIMDGNRRWAKQKFLPTAAGHSEGVKALKRTVTFAQDIGIEVITVYAFSTENWQRKQEEVDFLMQLLAKTIDHELSELYEKNVRMKFIGDLSRFSPELRKILANEQEKFSYTKLFSSEKTQIFY